MGAISNIKTLEYLHIKIMNEIIQDTSIELSKEFPELKISFRKHIPNA